MFTTSVTLLEHLRQPDDANVNGMAWTRFVRLYTPLFYAWARRLGAAPADADDLVQDVFTILVQQLPHFAYDRGRSFRSWLRTILANKWRDHERRRAALPVADVPALAE